MIGGDHSALSYKLPAGGKVGGTVKYPLYQNKISVLHDKQTNKQMNKQTKTYFHTLIS
jgi:hypothetical protein